MCVISSICIATLDRWAAVGFLYVLFFYESICYPVSCFDSQVLCGRVLTDLLRESVYSPLERRTWEYTLKEVQV